MDNWKYLIAPSFQCTPSPLKVWLNRANVLAWSSNIKCRYSFSHFKLQLVKNEMSFYFKCYIVILLFQSINQSDFIGTCLYAEFSLYKSYHFYCFLSFLSMNLFYHSMYWWNPLFLAAIIFIEQCRLWINILSSFNLCLLYFIELISSWPLFLIVHVQLLHYSTLLKARQTWWINSWIIMN